jgi:hypothetical protein
VNENAKKVIDAYLDAKSLSVPHAILVEGPWGGGKTYFLEKVYEEKRKAAAYAGQREHIPFLMVSLFGATSAADVELRIYKKAFPGEAIAGAIAGKVVLGIGEFFRIKDTAKDIVGMVADKAIKRLNEFIFVFDDLERVEPQAIGEVMGLVNSFVAEHERRVILVGDETKLIEIHGPRFWKDQNEKIVGRRARIEPDIRSVVEVSLLAREDGPAKSLMVANVDSFVEVARQSEVENLRSLSWAVHNAGSFVECLVEDEEIPHSHVLRVASVALAITLWYRVGRLDEDAVATLPNLSTIRLSRALGGPTKEPEEKPAIAKAKSFAETFAAINVESPPINYRFIVDFEKSGILECEALKTSIKAQFGFGKGQSEPAWRKIWHSHERSINEVEQAIIDLATELAERKVTDSGVILHSAGLAIKLRQANDTRLTNGQPVVEFFKAYIDELTGAGALAPRKRDQVPAGFESAYGLGFTSSETGDFAEVYEFIAERQNELSMSARVERAEAIFWEAETGDIEALFQLIQLDEPDLSQEPVLKEIEVDRAATLFTRDMPNLSVGSRSLAYRYGQAHQGSQIIEEVDWARQVYQAMQAKLDAWRDPYRTIAKNSLTGIVKHYDGERAAEFRIINDELSAQ